MRHRPTLAQILRVFGLMTAVLVFGACESQDQPLDQGQHPANIEGALIIDVRTQQEFDTGHIPGSVLLPIEELADGIGQLVPNLDQEILLICHSGRRSAAAAMTLAGMGYTSVTDLGGIIDWQGEITTN